MFGKAPARRDADYDSSDIDGILNSIPVSDEVDVDSDLDDPELLQQLQALASTNDLKSKSVEAKKQKPNPAPPEFDIEKFRRLAESGDDDIKVDFTEADENDPHLLNELSALLPGAPENNIHASKFNIPTHDNGATLEKHPREAVLQLVNLGFPQTQAERALAMFDNDLERATNHLLDTPSSPDQHGDAGTSVPLRDQRMGMDSPTPTAKDPEEASADPGDLQRQAAEYQRLALVAKKQGDKKKAVELLRQSKQLYQQASANQTEQSSSSSSPPPTLAPEPIRTPSSQPVVPKSLPRTPSSPPITTNIADDTSLPIQSFVVDPKKQHETLQRVVALQKEYKDAALHYKNIGNVNAAKQMLRTSKELLQIGIQVKEGKLDAESVFASLPSRPDLSLGDGKIRKIAPIAPGKQTFDQIEEQLIYQTDVCHNMAIQNAARREAFVKLEEAFQSDLITLRSLRDQSASVPPLHFEPVTYSYKNMHDHIPLNGMELKILHGKGIQSLDVSADVEPFVTWDFNGWPPENTKQGLLNKGETPVSKGTDPVFNFTVVIPITRTNRAFFRHAQRKKLALEVWHNKYSYGLFRRPTPLGKALIPLEPLVKKASIEGTFRLIDSNRKETGGTLDIQLNLREPLTGQDISERKERWVVLDGIGNTSEWMSNATLTSGIYQPPPLTHSIPNPDAMKETSQPASPANKSKPDQPAATAPSQPEPVKADQAELEAAEEELNSVDNLVSNMVLEHEIRMLKEIPASKFGSDMADRKQELDLKMNVLVVQVQTGMLDMDTYLSDVEKRIERDVQLALIFKKHKRLDLAKIALTRKKIMQNELNEAREAMAAQED